MRVITKTEGEIYMSGRNKEIKQEELKTENWNFEKQKK